MLLIVGCILRFGLYGTVASRKIAIISLAVSLSFSSYILVKVVVIVILIQIIKILDIILIIIMFIF